MPVRLHRSWWAVLIAEWMMESLEVDMVGICCPPFSLLRCSALGCLCIHPTEVQVLVSGSRTFEAVSI